MQTPTRHLGLRGLTVAAVALTLALLLAAPAAAGPNTGPTAAPPDAEAGIATTSDAPATTYTYSIETRGSVAADPSTFASTVGSILGDARGWTLGGSVEFRQTTGASDFNIVLASPQAVAAAHEVCSAQYSCRVGDDVLINDVNWRDATSEWRAHGAPLWEYRHYLINHEVGHWLGFGHWDCPSVGAPAPVMLQQSIDMAGCEPNGWPVATERAELGGLLGVPVYDDWVFVDVLWGDTHRHQIHSVAEAGIARGHQGYYYPDRPVTRAEMASFLARAHGLSAEGPPRFTDVDAGDTHVNQIAAIAEAGITRGCNPPANDRYCPDRSVTRAEMASFLTRALGLPDGAADRFVDVARGGTHADDIGAIAEAGITRGCNPPANDRYCPDRPVTRAEMASFLWRVHG